MDEPISNSLPSNNGTQEQLAELHKIIEPLYHAARGDYNQWSLKRDKKTTYNYSEAQEAIKRYVKTHVLLSTNRR